MEINKIYNMDCIEGMKLLPDNSVDAIVTDPPYEIGFMNKKWDNTGIANNPELWKECFRVLKCGGYVLSFGGTRTYHRMATAIEDAGFEIRDMINWVYGSGFPKSLNIGKAVDKLQGNERETFLRIDGSATGSIVTTGTGNLKKEFIDSKGNSEWEGWGTALKPAHEPIVMARKPLSEKSVALNVLKWGTGGINIDECRIEFVNEIDKKESVNKNQHSDFNSNNGIRVPTKGIYHGDFRPPENYNPQQGRFPANLIHDGSDEVLKDFPDVEDNYDDELEPTAQTTLFNAKIEKNIINSSRFFYCAKASKEERNCGCEELPIGKVGHENLGNSKGLERFDTKSGNTHPTIKPITLMKYLIKMVTPPKGLVLEPFTGSGTTAVACVELGINFIGFEKEPEYVTIANARINKAREQVKIGDYE